MAMKVKTAVIGGSSMSYVNTLKQFKVIEIAGVWDENRMLLAMQAQADDIRCFESLDDILNDPEIVLVINAMNPAVTYDYSMKLLDGGKHVFVSKLIADTFDKGKALAVTAKEKGLMLACGPDCFMNGGMQTVRWMIDQGIAGTIRSGSVMLNRNSRLFGEYFTYLYEKDGSILHDVGAYYIEPLIEFFGPVEKVSAFGLKTEESHKMTVVGMPMFGQTVPALDNNVFTINMTFKNGVIVTLNYNGAAAIMQSCDFSLYGDKGIIVMGHPHDYDTPVKLITSGANMVPQTVVVPFNHGFTKNVHFGVAAVEMAWSLVSRRPSRQTADTALHLLEIIKGIEKSADDGGEVYTMTTTMQRQDPLPAGCIAPLPMGGVEESALI